MKIERSTDGNGSAYIKYKKIKPIKDKTEIELLNNAEENLAYNLQWLMDKFDLEIRQGNKEVIERLSMLDEAWRSVVYCVAKKTKRSRR